jgi:hypothetical protein
MMLFVKPSGEGVEFFGARKQPKWVSTKENRRKLRDRVILLLRRCGFTLTEIARVSEAFRLEPIDDRFNIADRIQIAEELATSEIAARRREDPE